MAEVKYMTPEELSTKSDTIVDRFAEVTKSGKETAAALKALCEVMNVDPYAMKERMVINALKNDGKGYPGDLHTDALEVIGTLRRARDEYRERLDKAIDCNKEQHEALVNVKNQYLKQMDRHTKAIDALNNPLVILGCFEDKRRYTSDDMIAAQRKIFDAYEKNIQAVIKNILTEETKQQ